MDRLNRIRKEIRLLALSIIIFELLLITLTVYLAKGQAESTQEIRVIPLSGQEYITLHTIDGDTISLNRVVKIEIMQLDNQK